MVLVYSEFNKNLKTIYNFLFDVGIHVTYSPNLIQGRFPVKPFNIIKVDKNHFDVSGPKKLVNMVSSFLDFENCKKKKIEYVMNEFENGRLRMGKSNNIVTEKAQALAIAISQGNKYCKK